jgi:hypothetical protein
MARGRIAPSCRLPRDQLEAAFLQQPVLPKPIQDWILTTLREKLVKLEAKVMSHAKYLVFQQAEVAVPRARLSAIVERIGRRQLTCDSK